MADCSLASLNRDQLSLKNGSNLPHWPRKLDADKPNIITHYDTDRDNAKRHTALLPKVGGLEAAGAKPRGIHWHVRQGHRVIYMSQNGERKDHSIIRIIGQSI